MSKSKNDSVDLKAPKFLDRRWYNEAESRPWNSVNEAFNGVEEQYKHVGLFAFIDSGSGLQIYWYASNISTVSDLVPYIDRIKWDNHIKSWEAETLTAEMGMVTRYHNGNIWEYVHLTLPFDTVDIETEITEGKWVSKISTFPAVEFAVVTPKAISPNTTRFVQIDGSNLKLGTTCDFGPNITVLNYQYVSESRMLVELQSNGVLGSVFPKINNGTEVTLDASFSISNGTLYVPDAVGSPWLAKNNSIIYTVGGWESQLAISATIGYFSMGIPIESDCKLSMKFLDTTNLSEQSWFGFTSSTSPISTGVTNAFFRSYIESNQLGVNAVHNDFNCPLPIINSTMTFERVKQSPTTCKIFIYQNEILVGETPIANVTEIWYPYWHTFSPNKVTEIELLIS